MMIPKPMRDDLLTKIPSGKPYTADVQQITENCFALGEQLAQKKAEIEADRKLSAEGKRAALSDFIANRFARQYAEVSRGARRALAHTESERKALGMPKVDKADLHGEMQRAELRTYVRSLPDSQRVTVAMKDPAIVEALLQGNPALSGLPEFAFNEMRTRYIETIHAPKIAELDGIRDAYSVAGAAAGMLRVDMERESGMSPHQFNTMLQPLEASS